MLSRRPPVGEQLTAYDQAAQAYPQLSGRLTLHKKILQFRAALLETTQRSYDVTSDQIDKALKNDVPLFFSAFEDVLDKETLNKQAADLLEKLSGENIANRSSVAALKRNLTKGKADIIAALERYFMPSEDTLDAEDENPTQDLLLYFISRILIQNDVEELARSAELDDRQRATFAAVGHCLICGNVPSIVVRETADGAARAALLCDVCGSEYEVDVTTYCPICCGESSAPKQLVVFPEYEGMALEVCEDCRTYVKTIERGKATVPRGYEDVLTSPIDDVVGEQRAEQGVEE